MLLVSDFEVKILKANQTCKEHSLVIEQLSMDSSLQNSIDLTDDTAVQSHLLTVYILDKDTHRFMPICHIAQTGPDSISTGVLHTCLMSVRSEFGKYLRP